LRTIPAAVFSTAPKQQTRTNVLSILSIIYVEGNRAVKYHQTIRYRYYNTYPSLPIRLLMIVTIITISLMCATGGVGAASIFFFPFMIYLKLIIK
jgi:hypothetical protein